MYKCLLVCLRLNRDNRDHFLDLVHDLIVRIVVWHVTAPQDELHAARVRKPNEA
jgi:hypothetical protein